MSKLKGRVKPNVAGEKYDSNAVQISFQDSKPLPSDASAQKVDCKKWYILYPTYIDSTKSIPRGRKIPKEKACQEPLVQEMGEICHYLKINFVIENKAYPRDWIVPGRIRVKLKDEEGHFLHDKIHTRKELMVKMAELIPKLQSRKERLIKVTSDNPDAIAGSTTTTIKSKKKGKKKGKR